MAGKPSRIAAVDALRGLAIVLMAIDHIRDFVHAAAMTSSPTDLSRATTAVFLTRWITHFCAPTFAFTAGMGACFWLDRGHTRPQLSRFLATRGLWLILLELTVMRFAYYFNWTNRYPILLLVFWSLGAGMVLLAALIYLPLPVLAGLSIATIALHNAIALKGPARLLFQPAAFPLGGATVFFGYPLVPWLAVIAAGYCCGSLYRLDADRRRRILLQLGASATAAFLAIRALNGYGDPSHWSGPRFALSFLNVTKYPPSLDFLLMTLGPALIVLAVFERRAPGVLVTFGRAPLLFFVAHFYLAHAISVALAYARYGAAASAFIWNPPPSMGAPRGLFPDGYGYPLRTVYAVWLFVILALYPFCRRWAAWKATRRHWWLSYL
jgi:uncharacterized membrane protein